MGIKFNTGDNQYLCAKTANTELLRSRCWNLPALTHTLTVDEEVFWLLTGPHRLKEKQPDHEKMTVFSSHTYCSVERDRRTVDGGFHTEHLSECVIAQVDCSSQKKVDFNVCDVRQLATVH